MSGGCNALLVLDALKRKMIELSGIIPAKHYKSVHHHGINVCLISILCRIFCQRKMIIEYVIFFSSAVLMKA